MLRNKQNWLGKIRSTQILKHLAFFGLGCLSWLGFSYVFMLFIRLQMTRSIYNIPWASDAPHWMFLNCLIGASFIISGKYFLGLLSEKSKNPVRDFLILTAFIPLNSLILTIVFIWGLGMVVRGDKAPLEYELLMSFLMGLIPQTFVSLTCIGYFYLNLVNQTKERLSAIQQAKTAMELKTLQQNIEPHFLFNNLNVLSSLIESNPSRANEFLEKLSELYRYILHTQTLETVSLKDELEFARNYVFLLQERFGNAYHFDWRIDENQLNGQKIIPVSVQTLIENAVKHNAGSNETPLQISIKLGEDSLSVENKIREKQLTFQTTQSGLQNLKTRYSFLTKNPVEIVQNADSFKVKLPLILNK